MKKYFKIVAISHETALAAVNTAIAEAAKIGVAISVAIVDPSLTLVAFAKTDGATMHSIETSRKKAATAASTKRPTGWMDNTLAVTLPMASNNLLTNVPGGFPIIFDGKVVGGLGIAGGTVEQDAEVAESTIRAIGAEE